MNLENLTKTQRAKWEHFLEAYPQFQEERTATLTTADLGKALQCRPDHVVRLLTYITRGLENKLRLQKMTRDSRGRLFKADHVDLRSLKAGGRQRGTSKAKGLAGKSIWLHIWLEV